MWTFSCNKRHILWFFVIWYIRWFPKKSTSLFFNYLQKNCVRIIKEENYDFGQVTIHTENHKHHLYNESSTFFDIIIRILKSKLFLWTNGHYFLFKLSETYDKWYRYTNFDQYLLKQLLFQLYHWKIWIKICNFEFFHDILIKNGLKAIFLKKPPFILAKNIFLLIREVCSL